MTGENEQRQDRPEPDDVEESFILEDWDELDEVLAKVEEDIGREARTLAEHVPVSGEGSIDPPNADEAAGDSGPEDLLFRGTDDGTLPRRPQFDAGSRAQWGGHTLATDDVGLPEASVDDSGGGFAAAEDQQLPFDEAGGPGEGGDDVVMIEGGLDADLDTDAESDEESDEESHELEEVESQLGEGEFFAAAVRGKRSGVHEVHVDEEAATPDFIGDSGFFAAARGSGPRQQQSEEVDAGRTADGGFVDGDQAGQSAEVLETTDAVAPIDTDPVVLPSSWSRLTRTVAPRRWPRFVAAAAGLTLVGVGAVWLTQNDGELTRKRSVEITRTAVVRPTLDLATPALPEVLPPSQGQIIGLMPGGDPTAVAGDPLALPTVPPEPSQPTPVDAGPLAQLPMPANPSAGDPTGEANPTAGAAVDPDLAAAIATATPELVAVGEELQVGARSDPAAPPERSMPTSDALIIGDEAFALLRNGNHFVGRVKDMQVDEVTFRVVGGQVTFERSDVQVLGSTQSRDYAALRQAAPGLLRLTNQNRLRGSIVTKTGDGQIAVDLQSSRIVIPSTEVDEISAERPQGVRVTDDVDDAWIRQLVERRLEQKDAEVQVRLGSGDADKASSTPR